MSDKRVTRRTKRQGQSHPKSCMQALGDILYANEQKSQNAFRFLYRGSIDYSLQHEEPKEPKANAHNYASMKKAYDDESRECLMVIKASILERNN